MTIETTKKKFKDTAWGAFTERGHFIGLFWSKTEAEEVITKEGQYVAKLKVEEI